MAGGRRPNYFGRRPNFFGRRRPIFFGNAGRRPPWMPDIPPWMFSPAPRPQPGVRIIATDNEFDYIDKAEDLCTVPGLPYLFDSAGNLIMFSSPRSPGEF